MRYVTVKYKYNLNQEYYQCVLSYMASFCYFYIVKNQKDMIHPKM